MQFSCDSWELYNFQNAFSYLTWLSQKLCEIRWARITVSTLQKRKWPGRMKERTSPRSVNRWMDVEIELKFWSPEARAEEVPTSFALNWKVGPHALLGIARAFSPPSFSSSCVVLLPLTDCPGGGAAPDRWLTCWAGARTCIPLSCCWIYLVQAVLGFN